MRRHLPCPGSPHALGPPQPQQRTAPQVGRTWSLPPVPRTPPGRAGGRAHLLQPRQCGAIQTGELVMNGGNCSSFQKETKTPLTSANNALMWAPVPRSPHKPGSVQVARAGLGQAGPGQVEGVSPCPPFLGPSTQAACCDASWWGFGHRSRLAGEEEHQ